jgi:VCBS repeat-containing protein
VTIGLSGTVAGIVRGKSGTDTLTWVFVTDSDAIAFAAKNPGADTFTDSTGRTVTWNTFEGLQTSLNSPPELDGTTYAIGTMDEDSDLTMDVSDFAAKITDADATASKGIAITAIVGNGTWEYSINGGTTWIEIGAVSVTNALLLSAETNDNNQIRYTGDQENGQIASISFKAWDQSASTSPGDYVDPVFTQYGLYSEDTDTATITVSDVNDPPIASDDAYDVYDDASVNGNVITDAAGEDTDVDNGDTLDATLVSGPAYGTLTHFNSDGSFTYVADDAHWDSLGPGQTEDVTFTYEITDSSGATDQAVVTITVMGLNDAPVLTVDDNSGAVTEDESAPDLNASSGLSVTEVNDGDSVIISTTYNDDAVWTGGNLTSTQIAQLTGNFTADSDSWDYAVANSNVQFLADGETVTFSYGLTAADEYGGSDSDWQQRVKLLADDGSADAGLGVSVMVSGDYAIVGAVGDDEVAVDAGAAYIFHWNGTVWEQQAKLTAADGAAEDFFGGSVSISGDYVIVGASGDDDNGSDSGSAYIFHWNGTMWEQQAKLTAADGAAEDFFGYSVSISGDYVIVGASGDDDNGSDSGSAYIFHWNGAVWGQQAKLTAADGAKDDFFGDSVSISGDYVIVGAYGDDQGEEFSAGAAYIFHRSGTVWAQEEKLTADDGKDSDFFGCSVSISVDYAIVGAYGDDDNGNDSGSAYLFHWDGGGWTQQEKLTSDDGEAGDLFGGSVSISGDYAIVGALGDDDNGNLSGAAYLFHWDDSSWTQQEKLTSDDGEADDFFGISVGISDDNAIVGAPGDIDNGTPSGSAYIFDDRVIITITGVNDAPTVDAPISETATEDDPTFAVDLLEGASDPDTTDTLSVSGLTLVSGDDSGITIGTNSLTVDPSAYNSLAKGESEIIEYSYNVVDGNGGSTAQTATITIIGVNDAPVLIVNDNSGAVIEDAANPNLTDSGSLTVTDADTTDTLTMHVSYNDDAVWTGGTLTLDQIIDLSGGFTADTDSWDYTVANNDVQFLGEGETVTFSYVVTVTDGNGGTDSGTVTITIHGVDDAPTSSSNTVTTDEDSAYTFETADFKFHDVDANDLLQAVKITDLPGDGILTWDGSPVELDDTIPIDDIVAGSLLFKPAPDANGQHYADFKFAVYDGRDFSESSYTMTFDVEPVNDAPVVSAPRSATLLEDTSVTINDVSITEVDMDKETGGIRVTLRVTHGTVTLSEASGLSFVSGANGTNEMTFTGLLDDVNSALATMTYAPLTNYYGSDSLNIHVDDLGNFGRGDPGVADATIRLSVMGVPEFDEFGKPDQDYSSDLNDWQLPDPLKTVHSIPTVGRLIDSLHELKLLPSSLKGGERPSVTDGYHDEVYQLGILLHEAILGANEESRDRAWEGLLTFASYKKKVDEEWLNLADFLAMLRDWQVGESRGGKILVLDLGQIKLAEWFDSLTASPEALSTEGQSAASVKDEVHESISNAPLLFDLDKVTVADLLSQNREMPASFVACESGREVGVCVSRTFDLKNISFVDALAS